MASQPNPLVAQLKAAREDKDISPAALARRLGYQAETLRNWEAGRSAPDADALIDWANALGLRLVLARPATGRGRRVIPAAPATRRTA